MRFRRVLIVMVLILAACGGGDSGGDEGDGEADAPATASEEDFDPNALVIFVAQGSTLTRVEPNTDAVDELLGGLSNCFETWFIDGSVWVACSEGRLVRVDPSSGEIQLDVETGAFIEDIEVGEGAVWVLNGSVGIMTELKKIDPASGDVLATITPDAGAFFKDIAVGAGAVWAVGGSAETIAVIARIDPVTAAVSTLIDTGMGPERVAVGFGSVYAVGGGFLNADGTGDLGLDLVRIDPATNEVVEKLDVGEVDGFPDLALAYDSVWLTDTAAGELVRVNPDATEVIARIVVGSGGQDLYEVDIAKGLVWAGNPFDGRIFGVDPATNESVTGIEGGATKGVAFQP